MMGLGLGHGGDHDVAAGVLRMFVLRAYWLWASVRALFFGLRISGFGPVERPQVLKPYTL